MSLLSDSAIKSAMAQKQIAIDPFTPERLQPASYDLSLGAEFAIPISIDTAGALEADWHKQAVHSRLIVDPGTFLLATTLEKVRLSSRVAARVEGKSTWGRRGLLVLCTAGFIDPGFEGQITLELRNVGPFRLEIALEEAIAQIAFERIEGFVEKPYAGKYQNQRGVGLPLRRD